MRWLWPHPNRILSDASAQFWVCDCACAYGSRNECVCLQRDRSSRDCTQANNWLGVMSHMREFVAEHPCLSIHFRDFVNPETRAQVSGDTGRTRGCMQGHHMIHVVWCLQIVGEVLRHVGAEDTPRVRREAMTAFGTNSQKGSTMQAGGVRLGWRASWVGSTLVHSLYT